MGKLEDFKEPVSTIPQKGSRAATGTQFKKELAADMRLKDSQCH